MKKTDTIPSRLVSVNPKANTWTYAQCLAWIAYRDFKRVYAHNGGDKLPALSTWIWKSVTEKSAAHSALVEFRAAFDAGSLNCAGIDAHGNPGSVPVDGRPVLHLNMAENYATADGELKWTNLAFTPADLMHRWPRTGAPKLPARRPCTDEELHEILSRLAAKGEPMGERRLRQVVPEIAPGKVSGNHTLRYARQHFPQLFNTDVGKPRKKK